MSVIKGANLAARFLLELCALAALGYWGWQSASGRAGKLVLAIGAPLLAAVVWGTFVAPKARVEVPGAVRLLFELAVFGTAVAALYTTDRPRLALLLAAAYAVTRVLKAVWNQ